MRVWRISLYDNLHVINTSAGWVSSHEINSHEINSHEVNSQQIQTPVSYTHLTLPTKA